MVAKSPSKPIWITVFISCFLGLIFDGMDMQILSLTLSKLMQEFHISKGEAGLLGTWSLVGMAIGGIAGGWLSDRYGRVRIAAWMMVVFSIGTTLLAFAQTYEQFLMLRTISAIGIGAEYTVITMLMAEYVPTKKRTTILGSLQAAYSVGFLAITLLAGWVLPSFGWRFLYLVNILPVFLAIYIGFKIPEPKGWKERVQKSRTGKKNQWITLFKEPKTRSTFLLWTFTAIFLQFGYFGVGTWLPTYIVSELGFNYTKMTGYLVGTYTAMILGKVITGWLADKYGRRPMFVIGGLATAIALPVINTYHTPGNIIVLLTIFGFLYGIQYAVIATYMNESFPTHIRGTAVGGSYNVGRFGAAIAPILIGIIAEHKSIGFGFAMLGISYALSGLLPALFIREKMYDPFDNEINISKEYESVSEKNNLRRKIQLISPSLYEGEIHFI
ncbi:MFS transporter [Aneurinibacillus tyrosinisolvens]|uniref:MFS transporter n=1 Tax=Aneurinibacillus tyrosinisolvens TaxID=1443435 RepID=UPI0009E26497|nr:MFS transporter [Aneurinibacillus tyrosinisolvens]